MNPLLARILDADRGGHRARDDSAHGQRVLGSHGDRDHGRAHDCGRGDEMNKSGSLLDELRVRYEAVQESTDDHGEVESFEAIDARGW